MFMLVAFGLVAAVAAVVFTGGKGKRTTGADYEAQVPPELLAPPKAQGLPIPRLPEALPFGGGVLPCLGEPELVGAPPGVLSDSPRMAPWEGIAPSDRPVSDDSPLPPVAQIPIPTAELNRITPWDGIAPPDRPVMLPVPAPPPKDAVPTDPVDSTPFDTPPPDPVVLPGLPPVGAPVNVPVELMNPPVIVAPDSYKTQPPVAVPAEPTPTVERPSPPAPVAAPVLPAPKPAPAPPPPPPPPPPPARARPSSKFKQGSIVAGSGGIFGLVVKAVFNTTSWEWQYSVKDLDGSTVTARETSLKLSAF